MKNNKAFTLIELLVVVLIIGILAAVALPQYQKAVAKTRGVELISMLNTAIKSLDLYLLNSNECCGYFYSDGPDSHWDALDITIPISDKLKELENIEIFSEEDDNGHEYGAIYLGAKELPAGQDLGIDLMLTNQTGQWAIHECNYDDSYGPQGKIWCKMLQNLYSSAD